MPDGTDTSWTTFSTYFCFAAIWFRRFLFMKSRALSVGLVAYIVVKVYSLHHLGLQPLSPLEYDTAEPAEVA